MVKNTDIPEQANDGQAPARKYPIVNLVIDIQDHRPPPEGVEITTHRKPMDPEQREEYLKATKKTIQDLADKGIPTIYIAIGDSSQIYPGTRSDPNATRDPGLVAQLGLTGIDPGLLNDVVLKRFMDTFTDINDVRASPTLSVYIAGQRGDNVLDTSNNIRGASFGELTFAQHLENLGVEHVTIMGSMAEFCITDNALGALLRGKGIQSATILSDRVIGWNDDSWTQPVWHRDNPKAHEDSIKATLAEVRRDPAARGFSDKDGKDIVEKVAAAIDEGIKIETSADYLARQPDQKLDSAPIKSKHLPSGSDGYGRDAAKTEPASTPQKAEPAARRPSQMKIG